MDERPGSRDAEDEILVPTDGTVVPRFAGPATFVRMPSIDQVGHYDVAVLGAPFDGRTSFRPGARFGPVAVRPASRNFRPSYHSELGLSPLPAMQVVDVDAGDVPVNPFSITEVTNQIHRFAHDVSRNDSRLVTIGGDHTIALPLLRAVAERRGPVALVHFDAHLDSWDTYFGAPITHGTVFRRAFEEGLLLPEHIDVLDPAFAPGTGTPEVGG